MRQTDGQTIYCEQTAASSTNWNTGILLKVAFSQKDFILWTEEILSSILQQNFCPGKKHEKMSDTLTFADGIKYWHINKIKSLITYWCYSQDLLGGS